MKLELENQLDAYVIVAGLLKQRRKEDSSTAIAAIDQVLEQFEGRSVQILLENEDGYEVEESFEEIGGNR